MNPEPLKGKIRLASSSMREMSNVCTVEDIRSAVEFALMRTTEIEKAVRYFDKEHQKVFKYAIELSQDVLRKAFEDVMK